MDDHDVKVLEEQSDYILVEVCATSESSAIEQAERWAKMEGLDVADIARIPPRGLKSASEGSAGGSRGRVLELYYDLKVSLSDGDLAPKTVKLDQVTQ
jgi:hypothetical protein|tara:strand:+ start:209 stop:502 length:294 start_codon:yes stop_codon:yes gene_type:complete